jgi:mono/diheme cytochrome c family protein
MSSPQDSSIEKTLRAAEASSGGQSAASPEVGGAPIPIWLAGLIGLGIFWAGAYLFSFSGGFKSDVFDYEPKFGAQLGAKSAPDPKVVGKALFSSNCITCHQASGMGLPGQYPPLAGSEVVLGDATNRFIAIALKGLQGPVTIKGQAFNNAMQPWEAQYSDQQLASILTYVRSDWGNNGAPITADMVKQVRDEVKDRKDQWSWAEIQKLPAKNLTGGNPPADQKTAPAPGSQPAAPASGTQVSPAPGAQPPAPSPAPK